MRARDEDCDGQPNATDICPADPDAPGDDEDGDGVGDACDPDRTVAGNRRILFDGFDDTSHAWAIKTGAWQLVDGRFVQPTQGDSRVELSVTGTHGSVEVVVPDLDAATGGSVSAFGASGGLSLTCSVVAQGAGTEILKMDAFLILEQATLSGAGPCASRAGSTRTVVSTAAHVAATTSPPRSRRTRAPRRRSTRSA